jgi:hypothetical protein
MVRKQLLAWAKGFQGEKLSQGQAHNSKPKFIGTGEEYANLQERFPTGKTARRRKPRKKKVLASRITGDPFSGKIAKRFSWVTIIVVQEMRE